MAKDRRSRYVHIYIYIRDLRRGVNIYIYEGLEICTIPRGGPRGPRGARANERVDGVSLIFTTVSSVFTLRG